MRILIFGAGGMIGSAMFKVLHANPDLEVIGTIRRSEDRNFFSADQAKNLIVVRDIENIDLLVKAFVDYEPQVVINCIGLTKHHLESNDPILTIPINTLLPHRMSQLCAISGARFIHISTDCVFSGATGNYHEDFPSDAKDLYGKSKFLGETIDGNHALTLRTSTIGHELSSAYGLLEWFLCQETTCRGFANAIFSGLPNTVFAEVIRDYVLPNKNLHGLYHVGAKPIGKYELLQIISKVYQKSISIVRDDDFKIDRSLNSKKFTLATAYQAPDWPELINSMYNAHSIRK